MRAAILQFSVVTGDVEANLQKVEELTARAMSAPRLPDVLVLPELWSTGYDLRRTAVLASSDGEREAAFLGALAQRYDVAFAGGSVMSRAADGTFRNRAQIVDRTGQLAAWYDKMHLFAPMGENACFRAGEKRQTVITLDGVPCGMAICYDLRFGEMLIPLALEGAKVLFVSAAWPMERIVHWTLLARARAVDAQLFVIACNCCGGARNTVFGGHSLIAAPEGQVLAEADETEGIIAADLDLEEVDRFRAILPALADRRKTEFWSAIHEC